MHAIAQALMGLGPGQVRRWGEGHQVLGVAQALVSRRIIPWSPGAAAALHLAAGVVCTRKVCLWRHLSFGLLTLAGADWTWYEPCSPSCALALVLPVASPRNRPLG